MVTIILPLIQTVISAGASVVYFASGDWKRGTYWFAATVLTGIVTIF